MHPCMRVSVHPMVKLSDEKVRGPMFLSLAQVTKKHGAEFSSVASSNQLLVDFDT